MALKRFVDGAEKEPFFQKRAPDNTPDWIRTATLTFPSGRTADEIVLDEPAGLAWVANLGCLDLNPHPVRAEDLDHPDELRVDLDPVPGVPWAQVREVALVTRDALEAVGLTGWPKTIGVTRHPHQRPHRAAVDVRRGAPRRAGARPRRRAARPVDRDLEVVEGGAPRGVPRLQPERQGPHRRVGVLGAADAGCPRLVPAALGRGAGRGDGGLHARDRPRHLRGAGRRRRRGSTVPSGRSRRCSSCRPATRPKVKATRRGRRTTPSRRASRRASSRRASGRPTPSTRAGARTAARRRRSPPSAPPPSPRATRTRGCRPSGRARRPPRPGGGSRASR